MNNPAAGLTIASRCAAVILGGKSPYVVEVTSSAADVFGAEVPIPTTCDSFDKSATG